MIKKTICWAIALLVLLTASQAQALTNNQIRFLNSLSRYSRRKGYVLDKKYTKQYLLEEGESVCSRIKYGKLRPTFLYTEADIQIKYRHKIKQLKFERYLFGASIFYFCPEYVQSYKDLFRKK